MSSWAISSSGTNTSIVGTEQTLVTDTTNATYYGQVNLANMVAGDVVELRVYILTLAGDAYSVAWKESVGPAPPPETIFCTPGMPSDQGLRLTLKQVAGTARTFKWKLLRQ